MMLRNIKEIVALLLMVMLMAGTMAAPSYATTKEKAPDVKGTSVIMIESNTGRVIYEKNADQRRDPASITKILTCLVVLENMKLDEEVTVPENSSPIGVNINMKKGEVLTVEQLLYALMLPSANDAARVLAIATAGDIDSFCQMMNKRAEECGATSTTFTNPNGLNLAGQENHKTTARDLSKITREAMANKTFRKLVTTVKYKIPATNKSEARLLKNTNYMLKSKKTVEIDGKEIPIQYKWTTGVKTGTTSVAGCCFVGAAKRGNSEYIVVTLNSGDLTRFTDAIQLFDYGFSNYRTLIEAKAGEELGVMKVKVGEVGKVAIAASDNLAINVSKAKASKLKDNMSIELNTNEKKLTAPVKKGQVVGSVDLLDDNGKVLASVDAVTMSRVDKGGILSHIGIPDNMVPLFIVFLITLLLILALIALIIRRNRIERKRREARRRRRQAARRREQEEYYVRYPREP